MPAAGPKRLSGLVRHESPARDEVEGTFAAADDGGLSGLSGVVKLFVVTAAGTLSVRGGGAAAEHGCGD